MDSEHMRKLQATTQDALLSYKGGGQYDSFRYFCLLMSADERKVTSSLDHHIVSASEDIWTAPQSEP